MDSSSVWASNSEANDPESDNAVWAMISTRVTIRLHKRKTGLGATLHTTNTMSNASAAVSEPSLPLNPPECMAFKDSPLIGNTTDQTAVSAPKLVIFATILD